MKLSRSEQARVNGAKSHGPKTPLGKARSSLNALKHGRYAINAIVLSNEDPAAFEELVANYMRRIQPTDQLEYHLTCELAAIDWRLTRIFALDTRMLDHEMEIQSPGLNSAGLAVPELTRLLAASRNIVDRSKYPNYLARREEQLIRSRRGIFSALRDLRACYPPIDAALEIVPARALDPEAPGSDEPSSKPKSRAKRGGVIPSGNADLRIGLGPADLQIGLVPAGSASECGAALQGRTGAPGPAPKRSARPGAASEKTVLPEPIWSPAFPGETRADLEPGVPRLLKDA